MNERQLMELVRRDAVLHIPGREPAPAKGAYAADYAALLPKMDSRGKYIAGAAAGAVVIAGLAVGIRFLLAPSQVPTPDNSAPVSTAVSTGSEGTADRTDAPGTTSPTSEESTAGTTPPASTEATSQGEGTTAPVTEPTEPVRPPTPSAEKRRVLYFKWGNFLFDNGDSYVTREQDADSLMPDGVWLYKKPVKTNSGISAMQVFNLQPLNTRVTLYLKKDGTLLLSGIPGKEGQVLHRQVKEIWNNYFLTQSGEWYEISTDEQANLKNVKICSNIKSLAYGFAIDKDDRLISANGSLVAENVKDVCNDSDLTGYVTKDGQLYLMGRIRRHDKASGSQYYTFEAPTKVAENVASVQTGHGAYAYVTRDGGLYYTGPNEGITDDGESYVKDFRVASQVKQYDICSETLLYISSDDKLHGFGWNYANLRGYKFGITDKPADSVILNDVLSFACADNEAAIATCKDGRLYTWGADSFGIHQAGTQPEYFPLDRLYEIGLGA